MKKRIAFLACAVIFLLGGCQMENVSQKDGTDTDSIMEDYNFQAGIPPDTENENKRKDSESVRNETLPKKAFVEEISEEEIQKQELEREGKFRGQLAPGHNVPLGRINSGIKVSITFCMVCEQENAECKIILTDVETGEAFENTITETGTAFFEMDAGNMYSIAIENRSSFDVDFILDYFMEES